MLRSFCCTNTRDARHADAAEDEHDETDKAQIVLGAREVLPHLVFAAAIRTDADEFVRKGGT